MRVAVRTRLGDSLPPLGDEGKNDESEGRPNERVVVYVGVGALDHGTVRAGEIVRRDRVAG